MGADTVKDIMERPSKIQTKVAIDLAEESRSLVRDPAEDPTVDPVGNHGEQSTESTQLQPHQNRDLLRGTELLLQCDVDAIEVDPLEVPDPCIVEVITD